MRMIEKALEDVMATAIGEMPPSLNYRARARFIHQAMEDAGFETVPARDWSFFEDQYLRQLVLKALVMELTTEGSVEEIARQIALDTFLIVTDPDIAEAWRTESSLGVL